MKNVKKYSGFTNKTPEHLLLNAGAYFKNYDLKEDTFESAVSAGKLIGATRGGGEFSATPTVRTIEVDGVPGRAKGLEVIDSWDVYHKASVLEVSEETIKLSLGASESEKSPEGVTGYTLIKGKEHIEDTDYIDNITWVGTLSGSDKPVIIVVKNTISTDGLKLTTQDKKEASIAMTFYGHYTQEDLGTPPFEIYYPEKE